MPETPENIVLEYMRRFDRKLDTVIDDLRDLKVRVTSVETGLAGVQRRIDRVEERLDRIERRAQSGGCIAMAGMRGAP